MRETRMRDVARIVSRIAQSVATAEKEGKKYKNIHMEEEMKKERGTF